MKVGMLMLAGVVAVATAADAAVICSKKSGAMVVRASACGKKETQVNLADFGAVGPQGPKRDPGDPGAPGADGTSATNLWAVVTNGHTLSRGSSHVVSVSQPIDIILGAESSDPANILPVSGETEVEFDRDVSGCAYVATLGDPAAGAAPEGLVGVATRIFNANAVYVMTKDKTGTQAALPFHIAVFCDQ